MISPSDDSPFGASTSQSSIRRQTTLWEIEHEAILQNHWVYQHHYGTKLPLCNQENLICRREDKSKLDTAWGRKRIELLYIYNEWSQKFLYGKKEVRGAMPVWSQQSEIKMLKRGRPLIQ